MRISACLITHNEATNLPRCLRSVERLVDEIVIVDSGSRDATPAIAQQFKARFVSQAWLGYVGQKNFALDQASHPWILSLDADEEISLDLAVALARLRRDPQAEKPGAPNGYRMSRLVYYRRRWIRHGDWYPDRLVRLFRRDQARFVGGHVHERLEISGTHPLLPGLLHHYTYADRAERAERSHHYAELWALTALEENRQAKIWDPPLHAVARFCRGYLLKGGFLDGLVGLDIAWGNAREAALKYYLLRRLVREAKAPERTA